MVAHVLVPLKRLDGAKTRLAAVLSADERSALMLELLQGVLAAAKEAEVGPITIVSSEPLAPNSAFPENVRGEVFARSCALAFILAETVARQSTPAPLTRAA